MYKTTQIQILWKSLILVTFWVIKLTGIAKVHSGICPWYSATFKEPIRAPVGGVKQDTGPQVFSSLVS